MFAALRNSFRTPPPALRGFAAGLHLGTCGIAWIWWFIANWGTSPPVAAAMILVAGSACVFGLLPRPDDGRSSRAAHREMALWFACLTVWTIILPTLMSWSLSALQWVPLTALSSPAMPFCLALLAAAVTLGPGLYFAARIAGPQSGVPAAVGGTFPPVRSSVLTGIAAALCLVPVTIAAWWGMQIVGWTVAAFALCRAVWHWRVTGITALSTRAAMVETEDSMHAAVHGRSSAAQRLIDVAVGFVLGAALCVVSRMTAQLVTDATYVPLAQLGAVMAGAALGVRISSSRRLPGASAVWLPLIIAGTVLFTSAAFPWLVRRALDVNAYVFPVWQALPLRALLAAGCLFPLGFVVGRLLENLRASAAGAAREISALPLLGVIVSFVLMPILPVPVATACTVLAFTGLAVAFAHWWSIGRPTGSRPRAARAALACAVIACGPVWSRGYDPALSARLLFSPPTTLAYRSGIRIDSLPSLDDGRLIATVEGRQSTWTVWKHHAFQLQLRENGVPRFLTSLDPAICPQSSAEVLPAVLPLVIHPAADHVLLAGLGSTTTLDACLAFPVRSVTCVEADQTLSRIAREIIVPRSGRDPYQDQRLRVMPVEPALAAAAGSDRYDVVILNEGQAALPSAASRFTSDYYTRWARKLNEGGLLCQRFQHLDFGGQPLRDMLCTLQSVFTQVAAVETAPGEFLLLASGSGQPLVDAEIVHRCEAPHVRRVMSQLGWDWSVLLALTAFEPQQVREIAAERAATNSAVSGRFAFALPPEVMRGGPKLEEVRTLLSGHSSRMLAWLGDEADTLSVNERLADVNEQQRVIRANPDGVWAYRKSIRQRLQDRPRTAIIPVAHEGLRRQLHPEDERRKEYLVILGAAATQQDPPREAIDAVAAFAEPYDPLVSYFAHHEAARLLARARTADPRAELQHRLHTIYFNAAYDRSVGNVVEALEIVLDHPDAVGAPLERWDLMNSLLEVLEQRWSIRVQLGDASRYAESDTGQSLAAAERALEAMRELAPALPLSQAGCSDRITLLERQFIRPLRTYGVQHAGLSRRPPPSPADGPG